MVQKNPPPRYCCPGYATVPCDSRDRLNKPSQNFSLPSIPVFFTALGEPFHPFKRIVFLLPKKGSVVYEFTRQCDSGYVGCTTQRLGDRIKQHVPSNIRNKTAPPREQPPRSCRSRNTVRTSDFAIVQHLLDNQDCSKLYNNDIYRIWN